MPSPSPRYLTKSRFKTALTCPTKLFYTGKPDYADASSDNAFLRTLAEGGFQVGELAKLMYPEGIEVDALGHAAALEQTAALLQRDQVTIFEAAVSAANLFVRVDILRKNGSHIELIEVKAKSYDPGEAGFFTGANGKLRPGILPYLQDVAFQTHVVRAAHPELRVTPFLMMADKTAVASSGRINQHFKIRRAGSRSWVEVAPGTSAAGIGTPLLATVPVAQYVDAIIGAQVIFPGHALPFADAVTLLAQHYEQDRRSPPVLGAHCGGCEFQTTDPARRSGFHACWTEVTGLSAADLESGTVLDLWNFRGKETMIQRGVYTLGQVKVEDLKVKPNEVGLSRSERQAMQARGILPGNGDYYLDRPGLRSQLAQWTYPLHFIDFETSRTALPFHAGRRPYEQVAFQFSHHVMEDDGSIRHAGQFLDAAPGAFPNYAFVRELRRQLIGDGGTILRWATHENSVLRDIRVQLETDPAPPADKDALVGFIVSITSDGARCMVDLCKMAELYYFHPLTKGSCSIKKVLPAVLASSPLLRERYGAPVYGAAGGVASLNFVDWAWWRPGAGGAAPCDPYSLLPAVHAGAGAAPGAGDDDEALANGGAAMTAYARLQFEQLGDDERRRLSSALLKYCELDTLAMVMILQAWQADLV